MASPSGRGKKEPETAVLQGLSGKTRFQEKIRACREGLAHGCGRTVVSAEEIKRNYHLCLSGRA